MAKKEKETDLLLPREAIHRPQHTTSQTLKNLPEGKMFHTITYGKNLMGPHASQLNVEERWKVIRYVQTLQGNEATAEETTEREP